MVYVDPVKGMPEISRDNPTCFIFMIDQSGSMADSFGARYGEASSGVKADKVADAINRLLYELVNRSAKDDGIRDYFFIDVIGYGSKVDSAFSGSLGENDFYPISKIADSPQEIELRNVKESDGAGGIVELERRFPIWFKAKSSGGTPMCTAFEMTKQKIGRWLSAHPDTYPPAVFNITDGEYTDGDPSDTVNEIMSLKGNFGSPRVFNVHISSSIAAPIMFPASEDVLPDDYSKRLFLMSSLIPGDMRDRAKSLLSCTVHEDSRGFVFNADIVALVQMLDIGTKHDHSLLR
jgi:hypothetical protein